MIINVTAFLKVKLMCCRYYKLVRCSSCISVGKFFFHYSRKSGAPAVYPFAYSALLTEYEILLCCMNFGVKKKVKQSVNRP